MSTPQPRGPVDERRLARRQRLLDAFVREVGAEGLSHASTTGVCRAAGTSNRSFYRTFTDKADCFLVAFEDRAWAVTQRAKQAFDSTDGRWEHRVRAGLAEIAACLATDEAYARFCTVEVTRLEPALAVAARRVQRSCERLFASDEVRALSPPLRTGPVGPMLSGAIIRPFTLYVDRGWTDRLPEVVTAVTYSLARVVVGPARAARLLEELP